MGSVLISLPKQEDAVRIESIIRKYGLQMETEICTTGSEVLRIANERDYGVVVCTTRLRDMSFSDLSDYLPENFGMVMLTGNADLQLYGNNCVKLMMPFKPQEFIATVEMIGESLYRRIRKKKQKPIRKRSPEEQKIIDRAKGILMERNGMTEQEAYRYIQKTSMDTGRSSVESAEMILRMIDI